ncbi:MAG: hypothetical protein EXR72_24280 [Myxococcales bacterium]|nr:hypothetical protein [Myxococcales bacterium]
MHRMGLLAVGLFALGCGGFKALPVGDGGSGDLAGSAGADIAAPPGSDLSGLPEGDMAKLPGDPDMAKPQGGTGPGPYGALPSGYCCTANVECRFRRCLAMAGGMMCSDNCDGDGSCPEPEYKCIGATMFDPGRCEPVVKAMKCTLAAMFQRGAKKLGACCSATHDWKAGLECEGGRCDAFGDIKNPFICNQACAKAADCPGAYKCTPIDDNLSICLPFADPYTCS